MRYVLYAIGLYLLFILIKFLLRIFFITSNKGKQKVKSSGDSKKSALDRTQIQDAEFEELNNKRN